MKRILFAIAISLLCTISAFAQKTWFCSDPGTKLYYVQKDAKGKPAGDGFHYVIKDVNTEDGKTTITFDAIVFGKDGVAQDPVGCKVWSADGYYHTDTRAALGQYGSAFSAKGHGPIMPENPTLGEELDESTITIEALATTANYTNVSFTKHESITTDAGTFDCWCLEYTVNAKVAIIKTESQTEMWVAKGVGVVREVTKDKKGKVTKIMELSRIE